MEVAIVTGKQPAMFSLLNITTAPEDEELRKRKLTADALTLKKMREREKAARERREKEREKAKEKGMLPPALAGRGAEEGKAKEMTR